MIKSHIFHHTGTFIFSFTKMKCSKVFAISLLAFAIFACSWASEDEEASSGDRVKRQLFRSQTSNIKSSGPKERPATSTKTGKPGRGRPRPVATDQATPNYDVENVVGSDYNNYPKKQQQQQYVAAPAAAAAPYDVQEEATGAYGSRKPVLINTQPAASSGYKPRPAYEEYGDEYKVAASNKKAYGGQQDGYKQQGHNGDGYAAGENDIPGTPGVDYPVYHSIPDTKFDCSSVPVRPGMYADVDSGCQVYRICHDGRHGKGGAAFLCHNGTIFNQAEFTCDWWYNVDCKYATELYRLNEDPLQNPFLKNEYLKNKDEEKPAYPTSNNPGYEPVPSQYSPYNERY